MSDGVGISDRPFFTAPSRAVARSRLLSTAIVFALWAVFVAIGVLHHEFWRDEVRALSLALRGDGLWSIPGEVRGEGHPFLWYFLLRAAHDLTGSVLVLPATSVLIAAAAVLLFLLRAPFPLWLRCLFVFGGLPLYEYSVMARNYGISMLLMFLFAEAYTRERRSPLMLGAILFLLANTNVHSAALVPLFLAVWVSDWWRERRDLGRTRETGAALSIGVGIALAGIAACFFSVYPSVHDLMTARHAGRQGAFEAVAVTLLDPGSLYRFDLPFSRSATLRATAINVGTTLLLYASTLGLISRPRLFLAALAGLWLHALLFVEVYPGSYRHQGLWIVYLLTLYWLAAGQPAIRPVAHRIFDALSEVGRRVGLPALLMMNVLIGARSLWLDVIGLQSAIPALAELLRTTPTLERAIVVAEPDYYLEALPYYRDNPTYLLRGGTFGNVTTWTRNGRLELGLSDVLEQARTLRQRFGEPVVILIDLPLAKFCANAETKRYHFGWTFRCTPEELRAFYAQARPLMARRGALREDFLAFTLD